MEVKCEQVATLQGGKWDKMHDIAKRVYGTNGISPILHTCGGGNLEPKIIEEPLAYDEQNKYLRRDGIVGTLTTDGSSPKHNNKVVEPLVYDGNLVVNKVVAGAVTTREGSTRADASSYISKDFPENTNIAGKDMTRYRVRKLTERECFKLMGVKQEDFEKIRKNQSKSSCYHLAGDSIVVPVLMAIFGQMFDIDWKAKINETVEGIIKE